MHRRGRQEARHQRRLLLRPDRNRANGTRYGLAAGVQTTDIARAHRVAARLEAGIVWVNGWALLDPSIPFGGVGNSGWGRESGEEALLSYTRSKSVVIALD